MNTKRVYLDHAATTPVDQAVVEAMAPYFTAAFGNASSVHSFGQEARAGVDYAKTQAAAVLGCHPKEVLFTSGATESDNLALRGVVQAFRQHNPARVLHIITSTIEHPAVLESARELEREGVRVTYIGVDARGVVSVDDIRAAITDDTVLISIMYVNNEVGTIQPVRDIGKLVEKVNRDRSAARESRRESPVLGAFDKLYFHTDAVQAAAYLTLHVDHLHVDLLSLSAHKIYGPKGVGALYVREGVPLAPLLLGGKQEYGIRPGTYAVPLIVGFGKALEQLADIPAKTKIAEEVAALREYVRDTLIKRIPTLSVNGDTESRVANNLHISIPGLDGENALIALDLQGIAVSTGSACASASIEPSPVLIAMGLPEEQYRGSLRITLGKGTTRAEVDRFVNELASLADTGI